MIKRKKGFTLFELLVSISIIGILLALGSFSFSSAQKKARDARRMEDLKNVQNAAEQYYSLTNYVYPSDTSVWIAGTGQTLLEKFPSDPKGTGWTGYAATITSSNYCFCAAVENSQSGNSTSNNCNIGASGPFYCIKSQQ